LRRAALLISYRYPSSGRLKRPDGAYLTMKTVHRVRVPGKFGEV
jgi:hypothetical protein